MNLAEYYMVPTEAMVPAKKKRISASTSNRFFWILGFILFIRVLSFFTLFPDSVLLTRITKIALRILMTLITGGLLLDFYKYQLPQQLQMKRILPLGFYLLYLFMGICSVFWTTNLSYTLLQLAMTIENFVFVVFFYLLLLHYEKKVGAQYPGISLLLSRSIVFIALGFLIGYFLDPDTFVRKTHGGDVNRLGGYLLNPNEMGMLMVVGMALIGHEWLSKKINLLNLSAFTILLIVLLLTRSRSSLIAFFMVAAFYILQSKYLRLKIVAFFLGLVAGPLVFYKIFLNGRSLEEVMTLTDRLPFWTGLLNQNFPDSPIIGRGFMSISTNTFTNKFESVYAYAASMTHNTFIQVLINLGLVGAAICLLQMLFTFQAIATTKNKSMALLSWALLIPLLLNSMTEFGIFGETNHGILFYQFLILFYTFRVETLKK